MATDAHFSSDSMHFVICPWLAFGHLLPCLELADRLASRGHHVSYVSTPRNISRLPPLRPAMAALVDFVELPLPHVDGLPDGAEATSDVTEDKAELLRSASDGLAAPFSEFLAAACTGKKRPDWVIVDVVNNWAAAAAVEHKVPCVGLLQCAARLLTPLRGRLSYNDDWLKTYTTDSPASGMSIAERCSMTLQGCKLVALRSCLEWEPDAVPLVKTHPASGTPVVTLGLLPPASTAKGEEDGDATVRWLDAQPAKSVVYVALGSEVPLRGEQVHEMALGLELSGTRFLWALRKPTGGVPDADVVPPGFEERTRGRGLVVLGWVPQVSILAHAAVAAFLTHCGWSSTIEALQFGRPVVMLPIAIGDQWVNARLMEDRGVGVQVPRNHNDGSFDREGVATAVRAVTADHDGAFAANAHKLQQVVADRESHERCIDGFIHHLTSHMVE